MAKKLVNTDVKLGANTILPEAILDLVYPIGTIYETTSSALNTVAKMNAYFGGTWEKFSEGRVTVGVDTSQTEFNAVEKIGGDYLKTTSNGSGDTYLVPYGAYYVLPSLAHAHIVNVVQPYITTYKYKRTA